MVSRNLASQIDHDLGGLTPYTPESWRHLGIEPFGEDAVGTPLYTIRFYFTKVLLTRLDLRTFGLPEDTKTLCITRDEALRIGYIIEQWLARRDKLPEPKKSRK
jgi:hypothetical protein